MHENYSRIGRAASGKVQFDLPTDLACPQTGKGGFAVNMVILAQSPMPVKFDFPGLCRSDACFLDICRDSTRYKPDH